eukprot:1075354-Pyramimonas_sp.AAC.1
MRANHGTASHSQQTCADAIVDADCIGQKMIRQCHGLELLFSSRLAGIGADIPALQATRLNLKGQMARAKVRVARGSAPRFGLSVRAQRCRGAKCHRNPR